MQTSTLFVTIILLSVFGYYFGYRRAFSVSRDSGGIKTLHSLPTYYGFWVALWCAIPALLVLAVWGFAQGPLIDGILLTQLPEKYAAMGVDERQMVVGNIKTLAEGGMVISPTEAMEAAAEDYRRYRSLSSLSMAALALATGVAGLAWTWRRVSPELRARTRVEKMLQWLLIACASLAVLTTVGIVLSVLFEALRFFNQVSIFDFMFGTHWSPQIAIRADQVGASGAFGAVPLFVGTLLISAIALLVAVPTGLMSAIYLSEYATPRFRSAAKPALEMLAGVPTVVYGFFAALTVGPFLRDAGVLVGLDVSSQSALAAGLVMGIMIIPFVSSLADDVISAVPQTLRNGSLGLGATQSETIRKVVVPAALPGIVGGVLLAASRAIGETMIVVMAAGLTAKMTANPLEDVTTVTAQIVTLLVGDQEFDSPKTLAAFALGLMLFLTTLVLNVVALRVVRKYREQYD
ncbi:MAG: phosphate ABC transporter permease subunit PstC [Pseudomonadota bacterium]